MRLQGDAQACRRTARELGRAAAAAEAERTAMLSARAAAVGWAGRSATAWQAQSSEHAGGLGREAARLHAVGQRVMRFADALDELQARSRVLELDALGQGLHVAEHGRIAALPPAETFDDHVQAAHAEAARQRLVVRARSLRVEEQALHDELVRDLQVLADVVWVPPPGCRPEEQPTGSAWSPSGYDAPVAGLAAADAAGRWSRGPALLGKIGGHPVTGGVITAGTDLALGKEWDDTAIKFGMTTGVTAAAVVVAGLALTAAPALVTGAAVVGVGAAASYVGTRLFDAHGHHLPFVDGPSKRKRRCR